MNSSYAIPAVALVVVATVLVGAFGLRISRTTSDFYVASRTVGPRLNAAAISGEYLSAASFLGIAGLVLVQGPEMLWYPVGYTAYYLVLLLFVAAPLRRSGAYTLPDFAEARLASQAVRRLAGAFVVGVGWLYLLPQLQGAGLTLTVLTGARDWLGGVIVAVVVTATVAMRRHAQHHLRAGLPVLAETHRPARPRPLPGPRLAERRSPAPRLRRTGHLPRTARRPRGRQHRPHARPTADGHGDRHRGRPYAQRYPPRTPHAAPTTSNAAPGSPSPRGRPSPRPSAAAAAICRPRRTRAAGNARCTPRTG